MEQSEICDRFYIVMHKTYLILGSNIRPRLVYMDRAKKLLEEKAGKILKESALYATEPWGMDSHDLFLNQVILLETELDPGSLLQFIHQIEGSLGRERSRKYVARTIDIDILFWDDQVIQQPDLTVPHPLIGERKFVLEPLAEIAPGLIHPILKIPVSAMLEGCKDQKEVFILAAHEPADSI